MVVRRRLIGKIRRTDCRQVAQRLLASLLIGIQKVWCIQKVRRIRKVGCIQKVGRIRKVRSRKVCVQGACVLKICALEVCGGKDDGCLGENGAGGCQ